MRRIISSIRNDEDQLSLEETEKNEDTGGAETEVLKRS